MFQRLAAAFCLLVLLCANKAYSLDIGQPLNFNPGATNSSQPYLLKTRTGAPVEFQHRTSTLEEMIVRAPYPAQFMQPIPLHGVRVPGLNPKSVDTLGFQYFAVVDNTNYTRMSEIYKDSRLSGKSNFVTADSIIHPYLAFTNRVMADVTISQVVPDLRALIDSMLRVSLSDFKKAEDPEVREDLERNIAYLAVAMHLTDSRYELPRVGRVPELVDDELAQIHKGRPGRSQIFDREEDFSEFRPLGWYNSSTQLQNFYRCKQWLSRMAYPINDVSTGQAHHLSNNFRRSVLLFRSLDQASVLGKPAFDVWARLLKSLTLLGTPTESWQERALYAPDYKLVFENNATDLKVTLKALSEPFYRTKLLLAIRRHKPVNLSTTSIFELEDTGGGASQQAMFRFFPIIGEPESPWLHNAAHNFPEDKTAVSSWPISLLTMYAWGSPEAGNILADNMWTLDPAIAQILPELQHCVLRRTAGGQTQPVDSRSWKILSQYFKPLPEGVPGVLRTELWASRRLMSASAGWVDRMCSIMPKVAASAPDSSEARVAASAKAGTESAATSDSISPANVDASQAQVPRKMSKIPPFHYLDPSVDIYRYLLQDAQKTLSDLDSMHYMPDSYRARFGDFMRLFERLAKIAETEARGQQISVVDRRLLANIDQILDKVDVPLPSVLSFEDGKQEKTDEPIRGFNMAVGRPGLLFIIYQNPHNMEWTLGRGAVYTYYEMPAPILSDSMWSHKIEAGFAKPPAWSTKYELVQSVEKTKQTAETASTP